MPEKVQLKRQEEHRVETCPQNIKVSQISNIYNKKYQNQQNKKVQSLENSHITKYYVFYISIWQLFLGHIKVALAHPAGSKEYIRATALFLRLLKI